MKFGVSIGVVRCPACGKPLTIWGTRRENEPELMTTTCPNCRTPLESRVDGATGGRIVSRRRPA